MPRSFWMALLIAILPLLVHGDVLRKRDGTVHHGVLRSEGSKQYLYTGSETIEIDSWDDVEQESYDQSWLHVARNLAEDGRASEAREALGRVSVTTRGFSAVDLLLQNVEREDEAQRNLEALEQEKKRKEAAEWAMITSLSLTTQIFGCIGLVFLLVLYFVPTFVAHKRMHPHRHAITVLNVFTGFLIWGWVLALIWALVDYIPVAIVKRASGEGVQTHGADGPDLSNDSSLEK
jgi:hypothetical protein